MTITDVPSEKRPARRSVVLSGFLWLLLAPGAFWLVGRVFGLERGLLIALFAATPFVAAWTLVPLLAALVARRWAAAIVAGVVAFGMAACVLPRALPDLDRGPSEGVALRVLTINMLYGQADPDEILALVRDNDVAVLAVQEFAPRGESALKAAGIDALLPYQQLTAEPEASGSGLYSRYPMLTQDSRRNGGGFQQAYATIQAPGAVAVHVESVHPLAPAGPHMYPGWSADISAQPSADEGAEPRILLGDFNATLDHAVLRDLIDTGYRDAADAVGEGLVTSWPSRGGFDGLVTIDHVLVDERIGVDEVQVHDVTDSDHRAVLAALTLPMS
ncbi:endonuclease/exonuclease/phosphatase family protein [Actinoplanes sp. NBRC 101535]|uniref:endonuclease/exonuclease/phosphatase family protein n=1 Tax=Actinoplanes sp. NBRC 101535 TaxID=3032196 RepID=UPI0024A01D0A|nr:endonuclease/exonuclease/phosphatase family protein [Actinoplanes sp. NBRC 101535]GLY02235.1 endonuclease [Actinoplanes sp. NBRC 101535]